MTRLVQMRTRWESVSLMVRRRLLGWLVRSPTLHDHKRFAVLANDIISNEILVAGLYEKPLLLLLFEILLAKHHKQFADGVALDIGANIGNHSLFMSRYFDRLLSFEPNPMALALLRCNIELAGADRVEVFPIGLAEQPGRIEFRQDQSGNLGGSGFSFAGLHGGNAITVEVSRGDDILLPQVLGGPLCLVKIDIEGAELAALHGLAGTLRREKPIILFECNRVAGPGGGREVFDFLRELGYVEFLAIEEHRLFGGRWGRLFTRVLCGERLSAVSIQSPEQPPYSLIVALPTPGQLDR